MPKLGAVEDQSKIRFSDLVKRNNNNNDEDVPTLQGIITLGKEWRYYKKDLMQQKRKEKKMKENAERGWAPKEFRGGRDSGRGRGGGGDFRKPGLGFKRDRPSNF